MVYVIDKMQKVINKIVAMSSHRLCASCFVVSCEM